MRQALLALLCLSTLTTNAHAARPSIAIVIGEAGADGTLKLWWRCNSARPDLPVTDVLSAHLRRQGVNAISNCSQLSQPIHPTYHRARLPRHDAVNLGNAIGADRIIVGYYESLGQPVGPQIQQLGLKRQDVTVKLQVIDLLTEKTLKRIELSESGFATTAAAATESAVRLLIEQILVRIPMAAAKAPARSRYLKVRVSNLNDKGLDDLIDNLENTRAVRKVQILQLERGAAVLQLSPITAKARAEQYLKKQRLQFVFLP